SWGNSWTRLAGGWALRSAESSLLRAWPQAELRANSRTRRARGGGRIMAGGEREREGRGEGTTLQAGFASSDEPRKIPPCGAEGREGVAIHGRRGGGPRRQRDRNDAAVRLRVVRRTPEDTALRGRGLSRVRGRRRRRRRGRRRRRRTRGRPRRPRRR